MGSDRKFICMKSLSKQEQAGRIITLNTIGGRVAASRGGGGGRGTGNTGAASSDDDEDDDEMAANKPPDAAPDATTLQDAYGCYN